MLQTLYTEIESIVQNFTSSPTDESMEIILNGKFTGSSTMSGNDRATLSCRDSSYSLDDVPVSIHLKRRESRAKIQGIPATDSWISNDEERDAIRVDGLKEGAFRYSQMTIFLGDQEIEIIRRIDLKRHKLKFLTQYMANTKDPRPINESEIDHFFGYIYETTVQLISSNKD